MSPLPALALGVLLGAWSWPWWQPAGPTAIAGGALLLGLATLAAHPITARAGLVAAGVLLGAGRVAEVGGPLRVRGDGELRGVVAGAGTGREAVVEALSWAPEGGTAGAAGGLVRVRFLASAPPSGTRVVVRGRAAPIDPTHLPGEPDPLVAAAREGVSRWIRAREEVFVLPDPRPLRGASLPHAGLLRALVLGDTSDVPESERGLLRRTGTWHLVSISGLHIGGAAAIGWAVAWVLTRPLVLLRIPGPSRWLCAAAAMGAALAYAALAGWPTPAVRAVWMVGAGVLARASGRRAGAWELLAFALLGSVWLDPAAVGSLSFQLSFGAMYGMLCVTPRLTRLVPPDAPRLFGLGAGALATSLGATCGTLPVVALWFQEISPLTGLANLVAVPLIGSVATPLALVGQVLPEAVGEGACQVADGLIGAALTALGWVDVSPWHPATGPVGALLLAVAPLLARRAWLWALATLAPLVPVWPPEPGLRVDFLAVGQGDAALLRWGDGTTWLIDGGPDPDAVLHLLRREGVGRLDRVILSHPHPDHMNGLPAVLAAVKVGELWAPRLPHADEPAFTALVQGWSVHLPGALAPGMVVLHPLEAWHSPARDPVNDESLVVRVDVGARRFLFPGDVERAGEAALVGGDVRADVLKVAHHGSATSSTVPFIEAVEPAVAVISCGFENRYRHPRPQALAALRGTRVLRTDLVGTVTVHTDGARLDVEVEGRPARWRLRGAE